MSAFKTILFCLVLSAVGCKVHLTECSKKNPFIYSIGWATAMTPVFVKLYSSPVKRNFGHCQSEWNQHGSCCNEDLLVDFGNMDSNLIENNKKKLSDLVHQLLELAKRTEIELESISLTTDGESYKEQLKDLISQPYFTSFNQSSDKCWNHFKQIRGSSLCATCSGRSQEFFSKNKILVAPEDCKSTVELCENFFIELRQIENKLKIFVEPIQNFVQGKDLVSQVRTLYRKLISYKPPQRLMKAFEEFDKQTGSGKEKYLNFKAANICSMIMNLRKPPYVFIFDEDQIKILKSTMNETLAQKEAIEIASHKLMAQQRFENLERNNKDHISRAKNKYQRAINEAKKIAGDRIPDYTEIEKKYQEALRSIAESYKKQKEDIEKMLEADIKRAKDFRNYYFKLMERDYKKRLSNWKQKELENDKLSRKLESAETTQPLSSGAIQQISLESDSSVLMPAQDLVDSSIVIANGITIDDGTSNFHTLNTSLVFP